MFAYAGINRTGLSTKVKPISTKAERKRFKIFKKYTNKFNMNMAFLLTWDDRQSQSQYPSTCNFNSVPPKSTGPTPNGPLYNEKPFNAHQ